jgi:hypothetical protein
MIDNQRILRLRNEASSIRESLRGLSTNPDAVAQEMATRLEKTEADERDEYRKLVGQAHFLLDLLANCPRLRSRMRAIVLEDSGDTQEETQRYQ